MTPFSFSRVLQILCVFSAGCFHQSLSARPEALEVSSATTRLLPKGKEADGIIGDFVLRNDLVEAVISGNLPLRRANMSTFYGADGITPGCLYDLTLRGSNNDQITIFSPAAQQGAVSWVRIAEPAPAPVGSTQKPHAASIETAVSAETAGGVSRKHVYTIEDGWPGVQITTTLRNETDKPLKTLCQDRWTNFLKIGVAPGGIRWADSVDPADRCGYAVGPLEDPTGLLGLVSTELAPGQSVTYTRFLAVGSSPAEAVSHVFLRQGVDAKITCLVLDEAGNPVPNAEIWLRPLFAVTPPPPPTGKPASNQPDSNGRLAGIAYVNPSGAVQLTLPPGKYKLTTSAPGRPESEQEVECKPRETTAVTLQLKAAGSISFDIRDEQGGSIPCKAQFLARPGTEPLNLGPEQRAHGCRDQYHSETGLFSVKILPGNYRVIVTRGIEFSHIEQEITVAPGKNALLSGVLKRLVDTRGWVSADYHNHSTPSGDNVCGTADRLINLAAEHIEFAPATEHNRIYDWRPEIERLGLSPFLKTVVGLELTGTKAHFNAFPFDPVPYTQDNGAPMWNADPRITALTLREWQNSSPDRWVQINHPDLLANFFTTRGTGDAEGGYAGLVQLINGYETQNGQGSFLLENAPFRVTRNTAGAETVTWNREFLWLQMLNQGRRTTAVAVCDAHSVFGNGVGGWRMYLPSASDDPAKIDWRENIKAAKEGRSYLTTGPFLQVTTPNGEGPGATLLSNGKPVALKIKVQCTDWIDIDRVQILVNGRSLPTLNFTRATHPAFFKDGVIKFDQTIEVPVKADAHLIVVACGENYTLQTGYGSSSQSSIHPFAYHNPIWVDVDGQGVSPTNDPLDYPVTGAPVGVPEAKAFIGQKKHSK
jgi:hypothetical protein